MYALAVRGKLLNSSASLNKALNLNDVKFYNRKIDTVAKRGSVLMEYITNRDKRKNWHFNILSDKPKVRTFEKIHKPRRRVSVLNSLFIKNITDVISTGDIAPELSKYGVEITGVKISPCCKMLNVFWQLPVSHFDSSEDVGKLLTIASPKIRAELISRNVLGRVPFIFFLRDCTNERVAAFEKAMSKLDLGPASDSPIVVDDSFTKDMFTFKNAKADKSKKESNISNDIEEEIHHSNTNINNAHLSTPQKPVDMKCDIFGLDHDQMMQKVIAFKKKKKEPTAKKTALISIESLNADDLFDKIPGTRFEIESSSSRNEVLKKFQTERKMLRQKAKASESDNVPNCIEDYNVQAFDAELESCEEDFFEDEMPDKPSC